MNNDHTINNGSFHVYQVRKFTWSALCKLYTSMHVTMVRIIYSSISSVRFEMTLGLYVFSLCNIPQSLLLCFQCYPSLELSDQTIIFAYKSSCFMSSQKAITDLTFASSCYVHQCTLAVLLIKAQQSPSHSGSGC